MATETKDERMLKCEQARGVWGHTPPGRFLKLGALRLLLRLYLGQNATTVSPPVVSVAREPIEPSCQKRPPRTMRKFPKLRAHLAFNYRHKKLRSLKSLVATLNLDDSKKFEEDFAI